MIEKASYDAGVLCENILLPHLPTKQRFFNRNAPAIIITDSFSTFYGIAKKKKKKYSEFDVVRPTNYFIDDIAAVLFSATNNTIKIFFSNILYYFY